MITEQLLVYNFFLAFTLVLLLLNWKVIRTRGIGGKDFLYELILSLAGFLLFLILLIEGSEKQLRVGKNLC